MVSSCHLPADGLAPRLRTCVLKSHKQLASEFLAMKNNLLNSRKDTELHKRKTESQKLKEMQDKMSKFYPALPVAARENEKQRQRQIKGRWAHARQRCMHASA